MQCLKCSRLKLPNAKRTTRLIKANVVLAKDPERPCEGQLMTVLTWGGLAIKQSWCLSKTLVLDALTTHTPLIKGVEVHPLNLGGWTVRNPLFYSAF